MEVRRALFLPRIRRDSDKLWEMTMIFIHKLFDYRGGEDSDEYNEDWPLYQEDIKEDN